MTTSPALISIAITLEHCPPDKAVYIYKDGALINGVSAVELRCYAYYYRWDELARQLLELCDVKAEEATIRIDYPPLNWGK